MFAEAEVKHFKRITLRTITNITTSTVNWKEEFLYKCSSKILFIDTEKLSKMQNSSNYPIHPILLINSELPTLKMDFFEVAF